MSTFNIIIWYVFGGVLTNFIYDLTVSRIHELTQDEETEGLRLGMSERIWVGLIWPIFIITFIIKLISIFNDRN
jgi:hypothetical protein